MSQQLEIPSLGKPFCLGMLYNAYSETIIPGKSLWDSKTLDSAKKVVQQTSTKSDYFAESTFGAKTSSLNIEANLKISLLAGMIEVGGAAEYLNDEKTSERQARVTLKYSSLSRFEQLTMEQIGSIQYPKVLDDNTATHVVTGISYGTDAFFVFDRSLTESEKINKIQGSMEVAIKCIPISGSAKLDLKTEEKEEASKLHCKFYGDLRLPSNPSTFEDAVQIYHDLPQLINGKEGDKSTPKIVHLCPLSELEGGHLRIVRSISTDLVSQVEEIMQNCSIITMRANDLVSHEICSSFVDLESQITKFQMMVKRFKTNFSKKLCAILPKIRGEGAEESDLAELISSVQESPFNFKDMQKYLIGKNKEIKQLTQYLKNMQKQPKIQLLLPSRDGDLTTLTSDDDIEHVMCFAFNIVSESSVYVEALDCYLTTGKKDAKSVSHKEWFDRPTVSAELRSKSKKFLDFVKINSDVEGFAFAATDSNEETGASGPAVILYTDGFPEDYELPEKPETPEATPVDANSVNLVWTKSEADAPAISSYKVWYRLKTSTSEEMNSHSTLNAEPEFLVNELLPDTEYEFQVQAVSDLGVCSVKSSSCYGKTKDKSRSVDLLLAKSKLIEKGQPSVYKLPLVLKSDKKHGFCKYEIGTPSDQKPETVLMLFGATGAGKSSMINGIANYVFGVKFGDTFRFKVITDEASDSHKSVTAYKFYSTILDYTVTVIDTPEFGSSKERDVIKQFFAKGGIDYVHGIGFVVQSSHSKLTETEQYIFDEVLAMFGKDIGNFFLVATSADIVNAPQVMGAVKAANSPFQQRFQDCFKFNNSALFSSADSDNACINGKFWEMGEDNFIKLFDHFSRSKAKMKSLALTREVIAEREQIEAFMPGLESQMDLLEKELKMFENEQSELAKFGEKLESDIEKKVISKEAAQKIADDKQRPIEQRVEKFPDMQVGVFLLIKQFQMSNERLAEIALKPNTQTETGYLKLLAEKSEKSEAKAHRVDYYEALMKEVKKVKKTSLKDIKKHAFEDLYYC